MRSAELMNGADDNRRPSDLIYLFVDGEASDLERTILFNALVGDSELQTELADAIRINSAAQQEMFETLPPASVTRALFRRIEDLADQGMAGAAAAMPAAGITPDRPPVRGAEDRERRRSPLVLPLLTGLLGIVIGLLLSGNAGIMTGERVAEERIPQVEMNEGARTTTPSADLQSELLAGNRPELTGDDPGRLTGDGTSRRSRGKEFGSSFSTRTPASTVLPSSSIDRSEDGTAADPPLAEDVLTEARSAPEVIDGDGSTPFRRSLLEELAVTNPYLGGDYDRPVIRIGEDAIDSEDLLAASRSPRFESGDLPEEDSDRQISFFLRGGNQIGFDPDRSALQEAAAENLQNLAIGGYYQVDDMHGVGIQGGRDFHPFYRDGRRGVSTMLDVGSGNPATNEPVILTHVGGGGIGGNPVIGFGGTGDGTEAENLLNGRKDSGQSLPPVSEGVPIEEREEVPVSTLDPTIEWIGLGYRFRAPGIDRRGLFRPELQAAVGLSTVGPVARAMIGMAWKPGTHVSLVAGVEGTGVFYRRGGETYSSRRFGVVYGVEVGF